MSRARSSNDLQRNRVILQRELADDLPTVTGDRIQLQQVVLNLMGKASDAMVDEHDRQQELQGGFWPLYKHRLCSSPSHRAEHGGLRRYKIAVRAISEGLRQEAGDKLRVTVISSGSTRTNFAASMTIKQ
jgi:hypothetical protein